MCEDVENKQSLMGPHLFLVLIPPQTRNVLRTIQIGRLQWQIMAATSSKAVREITRAYRDVDARGSDGGIWKRRLRNATAGLKLLFHLKFEFHCWFMINQQEFWKTLMKKLKSAKLHHALRRVFDTQSLVSYRPQIFGACMTQAVVIWYHKGSARLCWQWRENENIPESHLCFRKLSFGIINSWILCVCLRKIRVNRSIIFCFIVLQNQSPRLLLTIYGRRKFS